MASGFLLDTTIVSYLLDGRDTVLIERVAAVDECRLFVSSMTCYELWFGLTRRLMQAPSSKRPLEIQSRLEQWSKDLNIVSFDGKRQAWPLGSTLLWYSEVGFCNNRICSSPPKRLQTTWFWFRTITGHSKGFKKKVCFGKIGVHGNLIAVLFRAGNIRVL